MHAFQAKKLDLIAKRLHFLLPQVCWVEALHEEWFVYLTPAPWSRLRRKEHRDRYYFLIAVDAPEAHKEAGNEKNSATSLK